MIDFWGIVKMNGTTKLHHYRCCSVAFRLFTVWCENTLYRVVPWAPPKPTSGIIPLDPFPSPGRQGTAEAVSYIKGFPCHFIKGFRGINPRPVGAAVYSTIPWLRSCSTGSMNMCRQALYVTCPSRFVRSKTAFGNGKRNNGMYLMCATEVAWSGS